MQSRFTTPAADLIALAGALKGVGYPVETVRSEYCLVRNGWIIGVDDRTVFIPEEDCTPSMPACYVAFNILTAPLRECVRVMREEYLEPHLVML